VERRLVRVKRGFLTGVVVVDVVWVRRVRRVRAVAKGLEGMV